MNWSAMNKQQRELLILKALAGVSALVVGVYYGLVPLIENAAGLWRRRESLERQIGEAEQLLRREPSLRREFQKRRQRLSEMARTQLPPASDSLLWATDFIHRHARAAGVAVERIEEIKSPLPAWAKAPEAPPAADGAERPREGRSAPPRHFAPFAVQVSAISGYERLKAFVRSMEQANPLLTISAISIVAREATPEQHQVRLVVEWPKLLDPYQAGFEAMLNME